MSRFQHMRRTAELLGHRLSIVALASVMISMAWPVRAAGAAFPVATGHTFRDAPWSPELVVVPPGTFTMGASEAETQREDRSDVQGAWERPQHPVRVAIPLAIGKFDVTRGEYRRFIAETKRPTDGGCMVNKSGVWGFDPTRSVLDPGYPVTDRHPANCVSWQDAQDYAQWLSKTTGHSYRLLHEAEWEYAARAGTVTSRWWGDRRDGLCSYVNGADQSYDRAYPGEKRVDRTCDDGYAQTSPVDTFKPNPFGLYDVYGNVEQWLDDCFADSYAHASNDAEASVREDCATIAVRGGTWHSDAPLFRSANRGFLPPTMRASSVGFRIVRLPDPADGH